MSTQNKETGFNTKWRPAMGWLYLAVCAFDFIIFPMLWNLAQATYLKQVVFTQWNPLTLQGAGFFHIAMGAVLGISAYGRTQEKIEDKKIVAQTITPVTQQKIKIDDQIG
jgi:hypothetical protein